MVYIVEFSVCLTLFNRSFSYYEIAKNETLLILFRFGIREDIENYIIFNIISNKSFGNDIGYYSIIKYCSSLKTFMKDRLYQTCIFEFVVYY